MSGPMLSTTALAEREWKFGDVRVTQTVNVWPDRRQFHIISTFSVPLAEGRQYRSGGCVISFAEAHLLGDDAWREKAAREHLAKLINELRHTADALAKAVQP